VPGFAPKPARAFDHGAQLSFRAHDDDERHAEALLEHRLDGCFERPLRGAGLEDDVAGLDVGAHRFVASSLEGVAEVGHGDRVAAADVDPAEEADVPRGWHVSNVVRMRGRS
jgi:hypothetical protein